MFSQSILNASVLFLSSIVFVASFRPVLRSRVSTSVLKMKDYTIPDQPKRFAKAKVENNKRVLNIDEFYKPSLLAGKTVLVTGGNRGIGLAITNELVKCGAKVIVTTRAPTSIPGVSHVIDGIEVTDDNCGDLLASKLKGQKIDVLINNAGNKFVICYLDFLKVFCFAYFTCVFVLVYLHRLLL